MSAQYRVAGSVAIIYRDNLPVNGLSLSTRRGIPRDLTRTLDAPEVESIELTGNGNVFSAGADISEFSTPNSSAQPSLRAVIEARENSIKPCLLQPSSRPRWWRPSASADSRPCCRRRRRPGSAAPT